MFLYVCTKCKKMSFYTMNALKYRAKARGKPVVLLYFHPQGKSL